jgi:phage terminase small subunit
MASLTPKQSKFIDEFLVDFNGTQAAIRAGYSPKAARIQASKMLANVTLQEALAQRRQELADANDLTPEKVIAELVKLAFASMDTYTKWGPLGVRLIPSEELPEGAAAAVSEISETVTDKSHNVRFKLHDKAGSLDKLLKYLEWKQETADVEARIAALEAKIEEIGITDRSNGKAAGYPAYRQWHPR